MLNSLDLQPNTAINQQIQGILLFDFTLVYVLVERFKTEDVLSRKRLEEGKEPEFDNDTWLKSIVYHVNKVGKEFLMEQKKNSLQSRLRRLQVTQWRSCHLNSQPLYPRKRIWRTYSSSCKYFNIQSMSSQHKMASNFYKRLPISLFRRM